MRQILNELTGSALQSCQQVAQIITLVAAVAVLVVILTAVIVVDVRSHSGLDTVVFICKSTLVTCFLAVLVAAVWKVKWEIGQSCERKMKEFRTIVSSLSGNLEDVKGACGERRRGAAGDEALKFIRLEIKILELFALTENLRTFVSAHCITEIVGQYQKVLDEFENMRKKLQAPELHSSLETTTDTQFDAFIRLFS